MLGENGHGQWHPEQFADEPEDASHTIMGEDGMEYTMLGENGHGQYHPEQFADEPED